MRSRLRLLPALVMVAILMIGGAAASPAHAQGGPVIGCQVAHELDIVWATGFISEVTVTNVGTAPAAWQVTVDYTTSTITQGWTGVFTIAGGNVIIDPPTWSPTLAPGGSLAVGMLGTGDGAVSSLTITCT